MGYKLLGMGVWKVAKRWLRRRFSKRKVLLGAGVLAVGAGLTAAALRHSGE